MSVRTSNPRTPILVGVGQAVSHWAGDDPATAPSPLSLSLAAARAALDDSQAPAALASTIDVVVAVRSMLDSLPGLVPPCPQCANPPGALAAALGLPPGRAIYSEVGGDQPQALVGEWAQAIFTGEARAVLLAGGEATATLRTAARAGLAGRPGLALDWRHPAPGEMEDRGLGAPLLSAYELANGLGMPTQTYPIFEHALRARLGLDRDAYRAMISELWAGFSAVAAADPYAQFPVARSADFLATTSPENYAVSDPYLKWHVAQDAVNQGAAVILTSAGHADALGIPRDRWVFLHGYAKARDVFVTERPDLSRSRPMQAVLARALAASGVTAAELAHIDLYSCFPCAVLIAAEALGLDWRDKKLTVTGGLPFFGGAGNNYSMHAIAAMADRLRRDRGRFGLVLANGGFLSKQAAGIYSTTPAQDWRPLSGADLQAEIDTAPKPALATRTTDAVVDSYTVTWAKGAAQTGYVLASAAGDRILARVKGEGLDSLTREDPIGRIVHIRHENGVNTVVERPS